MAENSDERLVTIPLRKAFGKGPRGEKAPRAMGAIRAYASRHMKTEAGRVRVSQKVHDRVWERGIHNPPPRIRVRLRKSGELVKVMLPDEVEPVKEEKKGVLGRLREKAETDTGKPEAGRDKAAPGTEEAAAAGGRKEPEEAARGDGTDAKAGAG
jgi:large subunit ribosomal protein L31e